MKKVLEKEFARIGLTVTDESIQQNIQDAIAKLMKEGMPKDKIQQMLKTARPIGDFSWFEKRLEFTEFNKFFGGPVRLYGIDGSKNHPFGCYGASTVPAILNVSPYESSVDVYEKMRGKMSKDNDMDKETIFYAGHKIEPVYRDYFRYMFGERYIVFDCDIQWASRKYPHFIGNCDGLLYDKETGQLGVLEIKHSATCW